MTSNPPPAHAPAPAPASGGRGGGDAKRKPRGGRGGGGGGRGGGGGAKKKPNDAGPNNNVNSSNQANANSNANANATNAIGEKKKHGRERNRRRKEGNNDTAQTPQQQQQQQQGDNNNNNNKQPKQQSNANAKNQKPMPMPKENTLPPKPKPPTKEELRLLAEQKAMAEQQVALQKEADAQAKALARREAKRQELESKIEEKITHLTSFAEKTIQHRASRQELSPEQLAQKQKDFQNDKKKLKSDLKKCTAFCKKIKSTLSFDETVVNSLLKDIDTLNLTRYLEEIANAFMESKVKVGDVHGVVQVCIALHVRYQDFMVDILLPGIVGLFKTKGGDGGDTKQRRIFLRVLTEMLNWGVLPETKPVMKIVADAAGAPKSDGEKYIVTDPNTLSSFAKAAGHELIGVVPKSILEDVEFLLEQEKAMEEVKAKREREREREREESRLGADENAVTDGEEAEKAEQKETDLGADSAAAGKLAESDEAIEISTSLIERAKEAIRNLEAVKDDRSVPEEVCGRFKTHLMGAFQCVSISYVATHKRLSKMEKRCEQDRLLAGSLTEQREKALVDARKLLDSLRKSVETLAEVLNESIPEIEEEEDEKKDEGATGLEVYKGEDGRDANLGPFDDEETRTFYCDIPDLLTTIPPTLLGYSAADVEKMQEANAKKYGSGFDEEEGGDELTDTADDGDANEKEYEEDDANTEGDASDAKKEGA